MNKLIFLTFFANFLLMTPSSWAQISQLSADADHFSGAIGLDDPSSQADITLFGDIAGSVDAGDCAPSTRLDTVTCSNCVPGSLACSDRRIHPDLKLEVSFQTTKRGRLRLYGGPATRTQDLSDYIFISDFESASRDVPTGTDGQERTVTFRVAWSTLCSAIGGVALFGDSSCSTEKLGELYFGIDGENNGVGTGDLELVGSGSNQTNDKRRLLIHIR